VEWYADGDGELAGALGNDALLSRLKLTEYSSDCSVLLTPIRVQDERVFRVEPRVRKDGRVKKILLQLFKRFHPLRGLVK
jgi:hypothetical protein